MVLRGAKGKKFTRVDRILMVAYAMMPDLICSGCGQPKHDTLNPDSEGWYDLREEHCNGCVELDKDHKANEGKDIDQARKVYLVDTRPPDQPLRPWTPGE